MIRVIVNGAKGKMGSLAAQTIQASSTLELVGAIDKGDNLAQAIEEVSAEVVVDLTVASAGLLNAKTIIASGARPVVGTSGFSEEEVRELDALCREKSLGGVIAPNFSIAAVLMMRFAQEAAKYLPEAEIIELHHEKKEESPSGTAIRTAELISQARTDKISHKSTELYPGVRGGEVEGIRVHSVRLPGLLAHQEVLFGGLGQSLTIRSDSYNREGFMPGVVLACEKVPGVSGIVFGLEHLL